MLKSVWKILAPFRRDYARYLVGVVVRQALLVAGGYSLVWILRAYTAHTAIPVWGFIAALLVFDAGLLRLDLGMNTLFAERVSYPLFGHLRSRALSKMFEMPLEWHIRKDSGVLAGHVNNGVGKVVQTAEGLSRELAPAMIRTGLSLIPLLWFSPLTTPFVLAALAVFLWQTRNENIARRPYRRSRYENYARDHGLFTECMQYIQPVVQFGQTGCVMEKYGAVQREIIDEGIAEVHLGNRYAWKRNMLLSVTKRLCQGLWLWQFSAGRLDIGLVMYLNMLTEELLNSFWSYAALIERVYEGVEPTSILIKMLDEKPAIADDADTRPVATGAGVSVALDRVSFTYTRGEKVLNDFSLSIEPGTVVGVVGRSGVGKTTMQHLMSRLLDAQNGRISICGEDIRHWPLEQLRGLFSTVSQNGGVFFSNTTILNTIRFARPGAPWQEVVDVAKAVCIHDDIMRMPNNYDTRIGRGGLTLSKGQQQRIALAQALLALDERRKVVILDEFTSALDSETEERVLRNVLPRLEGRTVILIAHRLATVRRMAQKIVVLDRNGVVEEGSHADLLRQGGWYSEMARLQATA